MHGIRDSFNLFSATEYRDGWNTKKPSEVHSEGYVVAGTGLEPVSASGGYEPNEHSFSIASFLEAKAS